jgi:hypothetical protein
MCDDAEIQLAAVTGEYLDVEAIGIDAANPVGTELMAWCAAFLGAVALEPARTRLVMSGDFMTSVRDRLEPGFYRDNYSVERNNGIVGGKTMTLPNGDIDVIVPASLFKEAHDGEHPQEAAQLIRHTVAHEAFHVAMNQAGENGNRFEDQPWVRRNFLVAADEIINEFRAESAVAPKLRSDDFRWDAIEILRSLRIALERIAAVEYQDHLDVSRLQYGIVQQCHTAWKLLGCMAAEHRDFETGELTAVSESTITHDLWQRMVATPWPAFAEVLNLVEPGSKRVDRTELDAQASALADILEQWLKLLGFQWMQVGEESSFTIESWNFLRPEVPQTAV